jgi:thioredoxin reductase/NAD-dependent dihydropyrimidine dehydrogenase PreA subunit
MANLLIWLAVFVVLALLAVVPVHFHLAAMRRTQGAAPSSPAPAAGRPRTTRPCPQCGHPSSSEGAFCEKCGVPMMLWQFKLGREVKAGEKEVAGGRLMPIVFQDLCIGCGACVTGCPEKVLQMAAGKAIVVNAGACTAARVCVEVCPTNAVELSSQGAARRVEVPQIDANFETNQKGIFAIGELGGLALIKNAVNEGRLLIEKIKSQHVKREGVLDLIFVGAGPAGLSGSLAAREAELDFMVFEQGTFADTIRRFPNKKVVMSEPVRVPMYGSLWISDAPKETLLSVWQTIIQSAGVRINENEGVSSVRRTAEGLFEVATPKGTYRSQKVVLAIGKRGTPRKLEAAGAELPKVMYSLADVADYTNAQVLVVGGGDSAAEAVLALAGCPGNTVSLSYRRKEFARLKDRNREALGKAIQEGTVRFHPASQVAEVRDKEVVLELEGGKRERLSNDYLFALLGGTPPNAFLQSMGVSIVTKEVSL